MKSAIIAFTALSLLAVSIPAKAGSVCTTTCSGQGQFRQCTTRCN